MKNIFKLQYVGLGLIVIGSMTSCSSYKHSHRISQIPEKSVVIADKIGVELRVDENKVVQATSTKRHASPQDAKDEAYYNAIVNNNIHVLVDPIYKIQTSARILIFGGKSTATVTGFSGYYQNPRSYKEIQDELDAEKTKAEQDAFDLAVKQMKQLKEDGIIKQQTSTSSSSEKVVNVDKIDKVQELHLNTLDVEAEYEVTKTTETSSLVDEYEAFLKGVKNPSASGLSDDGSDMNFGGDEPAAKKGGILSKLMFWKKK